MTIKCALFSSFILFILAICSCNSPRYVYAPTALNNPYFSKKGDSKVAAFVSDGVPLRDSGYVRGYDLMAAYAISNHVALTASYHHRKEANHYKDYHLSPFDTSNVKYRRSSWEIGAGYFLPLNKRKSIVLNLYGGVGSGKSGIQDEGLFAHTPYSRFHNAGQFKIYLQPGINFQSDIARFGILWRFNYLWYNNVSTDYTDAEQLAFLLNNLENEMQLFKAVSFNFQLKLPMVKGAYLEGQVSFSSQPLNRYVRTFNASGGIALDIFDFSKNFH